MSEQLRTRISIAWARDYEEHFRADKYLHVRPRELRALLDALDTARDLADLAAHVVCEPDSFNENAQLLSECVARAREALANFEFDHQSNEVAVSTRPEKHGDPVDQKECR